MHIRLTFHCCHSSLHYICSTTAIMKYHMRIRLLYIVYLLLTKPVTLSVLPLQCTNIILREPSETRPCSISQQTICNDSTHFRELSHEIRKAKCCDPSKYFCLLHFGRWALLLSGNTFKHPVVWYVILLSVCTYMCIESGVDSISALHNDLTCIYHLVHATLDCCPL